MTTTDTKGYRRQYSLTPDFAAAYVDESHRPEAQAACDRLNAAATDDNWINAKSAQLYGATAIANSGFSVVLRCNPLVR